jgi:WD40 repeat protein
MGVDGAILDDWSPGGDLEGVTIADEITNYIYLGLEHPDAILKFVLSTGLLTGRSWHLTAWMIGADNLGLEALTFIPNGDHPSLESSSGSLLYAGLQADGKIYIFDLNLSGSNVSYVTTITPIPGQTDLSGLNYDSESQLIYAVYDSTDRFVKMTADGTIVQEYSLPGTAQEGVSISSDGSIFIADDSAVEVRRYNP